MATFSWAAAADVGLGLFGAFAGASAKRSQARAENLLREGANEVARSRRGLAATVRGINNRRSMEAASDAQDAATVSAGRTADAVTRRNFEASIQAAEQWGAAAARGAASGLGGSGIEALSQVTSLRIARAQEQLEEQGQQQTYEAARAGQRIMSNALMGLEQGPLTARVDYGRSEGPSIAGALVQGLLEKRDSARVLLGSLVPGPQAEVQAVPGGTVEGAPLPPAGAREPASFAFTSPVPDQNIHGAPLEPRGFEQADVRRIDNIQIK